MGYEKMDWINSEFIISVSETGFQNNASMEWTHMLLHKRSNDRNTGRDNKGKLQDRTKRMSKKRGPTCICELNRVNEN